MTHSPSTAVSTFSAPQPHPLAYALASALLALHVGTAWSAPRVEFDPSFLAGSGAQDLDLSRFEQGNAVLPGQYRADVRVNDRWVGRRDIRFAARDASGEARLCLSRELLVDMGVDFAKLEDYVRQRSQAGDTSIRALPEGEFCEDIGLYLPDASAQFDSGELRLDVSIPQLYLSRSARGWVSPELWDAGIDAATLGYNFGHQQTRRNGRNSASSYLGLNAGLNAGGWRLRHNGYYVRNDGRGDYQANNTYAQRDLTGLRAQLTVGESFTRGDLFDGVGFRGIAVTSDDRMLPDSRRGYAPVVRGVAQTNAKVTIRQRDHVIYETTVAPGPFEIDDLYDTNFGGDLDVTVTEADGREQRFVVPFAAVPQLLRQGQNRFGFVAGQVRDSTLKNGEPAMLEATWQRGLSNSFTGYAGTTLSEGYGALLLGGAYNTRWGAVSGDVTFSRTRLPGAGVEDHGRDMRGQSARLTYSKFLPNSGTNFSVAAYRYSTDGYLSLNDGLRLRDNLATGIGFDEVARQRSRVDVNVSQALGERGGSLFLVGSSSDYWNRRQRTTSFSVGYSNTFGPANYSLSAQRTLESFGGGADGRPDPTGRQDTVVSLTVAMPLGRAPRAPNLNASYSDARRNADNARLGLSGTIGEARALSYGASASRTEGQDAAYNGSLSYKASNAVLSAGYSQVGDSRQLSVGASGGVVVHAGGVGFAQQLGETIGLLHVPGAANARVSSNIGLRTNREGYAVVPYLTPYRLNEVTVDPKGLPLDVELKETTAKIAPRAGAVVKLTLKTETGRSALIEAHREDGEPLPFGADVFDEAGNPVGVVGQASRLWVRGIQERGRLTVKWNDQQCAIDYDLAGTEPTAPVPGRCLAPAQ